MKKIIETLFAASLLLMTAACSTDNDVATDQGSQSKPAPLSFSVTDKGFTSSKEGTRATDNGTSTTFEKGDQMGMYVVDGSGKVVAANICLTYDGTSTWSPSTLYYYDSSTMSGYKFFTYFPYQASPTNAPAQDATGLDMTNGTTFFSSMISGWTINADQSSKASYTNSDLMIGSGTVGTIKDGMFPISFAMTHAFAMVELKLPYVVLSSDENYGYTQGLAMTKFPYHESLGTYRYIVQPSTATTIEGTYCQNTTADSRQSFSKTISASTSDGIGAAGSYYTLTVDGGAAASTKYTLVNGDYILNDGGIVPQAATNSALNACLKRAVGVVFSTSPSDNDKKAGFTHGYALALKNAATNKAWSTNTTNKDLTTDYVNTVDLMENDLDGLTHSKELVSTGGSLKSYTETNYPALYNAMQFGTTYPAYAAPSSTSGWYLPSMGQWYQVYYNLCGITTAPTVGNENGAYGYWSGQASAASIALDKYLQKAYDAGNTTVDKIAWTSSNYTWYWTSSEFSASWACNAHFSSVGNLNLNRNTKSNTDTYNRVRAVLAF